MIKKTSVKDTFANSEIVKSYLKYSSDNFNLKIINNLEKNKSVLSLGCGSGREVKELVKGRHQVTAIDLVQEMVDSSKKLEPNAEYLWMDAVEYAKINKNRKKFDYILGLFSYLNYIDANKLEQHIMDLVSMTKQNGEIIFEVRKVKENYKSLLKVLISPIFSLYFKDSWRFGDVYARISKEDNKWHKSHHFTDLQLKNILKDYNFKIDKTVVKIKITH